MLDDLVGNGICTDLTKAAGTQVICEHQEEIVKPVE